MINSASNTATMVINEDGGPRFYAGSISGNVNFGRTGQTGTFNMSGANTYTGLTLLNGGTTALIDGGSLSGTTGIAINFSSLVLNNTGTTDMADRVNDAAPIMLNGGAINFYGRASSMVVGKLGSGDAGLGSEYSERRQRRK